MRFPDPLCVPITNHRTGEGYVLVRATDLTPDAATLAQLVAICNEPAVYRWLFETLLAGQPYGEASARGWLRWAADGWARGTHFVFVARNAQGRVAAACDVKSNAPVAEVGYWASAQHRGVMTHTVMAVAGLAAEAGFEGLFARTKPDNVASQRVLVRAGFRPCADSARDGMLRFERRLLASGAQRLG